MAGNCLMMQKREYRCACRVDPLRTRFFGAFLWFTSFYHFHMETL